MIVDAVARPGVEETRARILAATRELYASNGSRGTTTREVAMRAGVNEATLFRHFGTKSQLLRAMLDHYSAIAALPEMLERVRALSTIDDQLRELGRSCVESMRRKEDLIRVSMAEELTNPDGHTCAWQAATATRLRLAEYFCERVAAGTLRGEPQMLARVFMSLVFAFVMARKIWADLDMPQESAIDILVDIFLKGALVA
ncbi:MAG: TetR/AcrR family transcriptional regulator [Vulcanimicrobiaceae bacterium]